MILVKGARLELINERETSGTFIEHKHHIYVGNVMVALYVERNDSTFNTRYLHTDHLGSIAAITDEGGNALESLSYDAQGKRRQSSGADATGPIESLTHHGYTAHEHDDDANLINMGARLYDPILGRFINPDSVVQDPGDGQIYNRYSYAHNNPLRYVDPTGNSVERPERHVESIENFVPGRTEFERPERFDIPTISLESPSFGSSLDFSFGLRTSFSFLDPETLRDFQRPLDFGFETDFSLGGDIFANGALSGGNENLSDSLTGFEQLSPGRSYYPYSPRSQQWGTPETINAIREIGEVWAESNPGRPFGVGDISLRFGGSMPPHGSHQLGTDVDLRPLSVDGTRTPVTFRDTNYDRAGTQALVDTIRQVSPNAMILFNDPAVTGVRPWPRHDNHLHTRF